MTTTRDGLPLGPGPRPRTGEELAARLRSAAIAALVGADAAGVEIVGIDAVRIDAELASDGASADIDRLDLDLTGLRVDLGDAAAADAAGDAGAPGASPAVLATVPGLLRRGSVVAHPLLLGEAAVTIDANVAALPIAWVELDDGTTELREAIDDDSAPTGEVAVGIRQADLPALLERALGVGLAEMGATAENIEIVLTGAGPDAARLEASGVARIGFMSAKVRLRAAGRIVDGRRLRLDEVDIGSRNPLAGAMLALARSRVEAFVGREIDLAEQLPPALRTARLSLEVRPDAIRVVATLG